MKALLPLVLIPIAVAGPIQAPQAIVEHDSGIRAVQLDPDIVASVEVGTATVTTLSFPSPIMTVIGHGIATQAGHPETNFLIDPSEPSDFLNIRCLRPGARAQMKVQVDESFYVLALQWSVSPDAVVTFQNGTPNGTKAREVSREEVLDRRPTYSVPHLLHLITLAQNEPFARNQLPEVYSSIESRRTDFYRYYPTVTTAITRVHRFPELDTLVFQGSVINSRDEAFTYAPDRLGIRVGESVYQATIAQASGTAEPTVADPVWIVLVGNPHGHREAIDIGNEFHLVFDAKPAPPATVEPTRPSRK